MAEKKFYYQAVSQTGEMQFGELLAPEQRAVILHLQHTGLIPVKISNVPLARDKQKQKTRPFWKTRSKAKPDSRDGFFLSALRSKVQLKDLVGFSENLSVLLAAGIPLNRSLQIVQELTVKRHFQAIIKDLTTKIREGQAFWQALQAYSTVFPPIFVNMVRAGEAGGVLEEVLSKLAEYLRSIQELKEYLLSASIYPAVLTLTASGSIAVLLIFVVPKFAAIFADMGIAMPLATKIMLGLGVFLQHYWWILLLLALGLFAAGRYVLQSPRGRSKWDQIKINLPLIGQLLKKIELVRFTRTLGTLLASGVSILTAMNVVQGVVSNQVLKGALQEVYQELKQGSLLSRALSKRNIFPNLASQMAGVGEETGELSIMLLKIADIYDKEVKTAIKNLTALFEPMIILIMGLLIGAMVVSMLLAIFSVNSITV